MVDTISEEGIDLIKAEEGLRLQPYADVCGFSTIGWGHLIGPGESFPGGITEAQAELILDRDLGTACSRVGSNVTVPLSQGEFDALVDFCFNLGNRLPGSSLLRLLNSGDAAGAEAELAKWDFAGGKPLAALKARRVMEMNLWSKGNAG